MGVWVCCRVNVPCVDATEARRAEGESRVAESSERAGGGRTERVESSRVEWMRVNTAREERYGWVVESKWEWRLWRGVLFCAQQRRARRVSEE